MTTTGAGARPRAPAKWAALSPVGALGLLALNGDYIRPYGSPLGQIILVLLLSMYIATLLWMRQMAKGDKPPRFVGASVAQRTQS